jgi:antitoxin component YwqK of YwqJK toxin-antitoxin module
MEKETIYTTESKGTYSGYKLDGKKIGEWVWRYADGKLKAIEYYDNGKPELIWKYYSRGGVVKEVEFKNGLKDGICKTTGPKGVLETGFYKEGVKSGIWIQYYQSGNVKSTSEYQGRGERINNIFYEESGNLMMERRFKDNLLHGVFKQFYDESGENIEVEGVYREGKMHDKWIVFSRQGVIRESKEYYRGDLHGWSHEYGGDDGMTILNSKEYELGKLVKIKTYYSNGAPRYDHVYTDVNTYFGTSWFENGMIKEDKKIDSHTIYYENGHRKYFWRKNDKDSLVIHYHENGLPKDETSIINGECFCKTWNPDRILKEHYKLVGCTRVELIEIKCLRKKTDHECLIFKAAPDPGCKYLECTFSEDHVMEYEFMRGFGKTSNIDNMKCVYCGGKLKNEIYEQV